MIIALWIFLFQLGSTLTYTHEKDWNPLRRTVEEGIKKRLYPGCVVGVYSQNQTLFEEPFGTLTYQKDIHEVKVTKETKFQIVSLTKIVGTGIAVISLIEKGQLSFDDKVTKFFKQYGTNGKENTTISNLIEHSSGLPKDYEGTSQSLDVFYDFIINFKPLFPVGSASSYSRVGYYLLGKIIEKVTNKTLPEYYAEVNELIGLKDTNFNPTKQEMYRVAPLNYDVTRNKIIRGQTKDKVAFLFGGYGGQAGQFSVVSDMHRVLFLLLKYGKTLEGKRVFSENIVRQYIKIAGRAKFKLEEYWYSCQYFQTKCFSYYGSSGVFMMIDYSREIIFTVLTNGIHPNIQAKYHIYAYFRTIGDAIYDVMN